MTEPATATGPEAFQIASRAALASLKEAFEGNDGEHWFAGLLSTLEPVSAEAASRRPRPGGPTTAGHTEHLRFTLAVVNAWLRGEKPEVHWPESWGVTTVDATAWERLRADLKREFETLVAAIEAMGPWTERRLTLVLDNTAHVAYHVGAIRQVLAVGGAL